MFILLLEIQNAVEWFSNNSFDRTIIEDMKRLSIFPKKNRKTKNPSLKKCTYQNQCVFHTCWRFCIVQTLFNCNLNKCIGCHKVKLGVIENEYKNNF